MSHNVKPIVKQAASLLELVFDEAMRRASERHGLLDIATAEGEPLWVDGSEAVKIMGAGYTLPEGYKNQYRSEIYALFKAFWGI